jgi:AdoMet-dependent rRNA methyltransferase SPB1
MPVNSLIVGVDLAPIKPIPKVITFQSDITTDKCRATIRQHLKTWKADTVLHDGAPNVGTAWTQDSFNQAELALQAMKLATEFLIEGGTFVTKVFRSKDYNPLLWVLNQLFTKVEATKPPSSRNVSAEIFVVCRGYKAPKRIDPRFLDPRAVFAELAEPTPNNEAKIYNPEVKKRKREGYEEGDMTQFKEVMASEFIQTTDPIAILGSSNKLRFEQAGNGDVALAALDKLPETTDEIRQCCADLRVLGRKEFKLLLKWRLKVRDIFGFPSKKTAQPTLAEEVAEVESMDEELKVQQELQAMKDRDNTKKKREKRRANEQKQKDIVRMQLHMTAPMDIGLEQAGPSGDGAMFALRSVDKASAVGKISHGKMGIIAPANESKDRDSGLGSSAETDSEDDEEEDRLERELDGMYDQYKERKAEVDAKYRAKRARKEHDDEEWEGVSGSEMEVSDDDIELDEDSDDDEEDEEDPAGTKQKLLTDLDTEPEEGALSKRARKFFNQDIFKDMHGLLGEPEHEAVERDEVAAGEPEEIIDVPVVKVSSKLKQTVTKTADPYSDSDESFYDAVEVVRKTKSDHDEWEDQPARRSDGRLGELKRAYPIKKSANDSRHRHYYCRSNDTGTPIGNRGEVKPQCCRRWVQQALVQGPGWTARLVLGRRVTPRQTPQTYHKSSGQCHQREAAGAECPAYQESQGGEGAKEVQDCPATREAEEEV